MQDIADYTLKPYLFLRLRSVFKSTFQLLCDDKFGFLRIMESTIGEWKGIAFLFGGSGDFSNGCSLATGSLRPFLFFDVGVLHNGLVRRLSLLFTLGVFDEEGAMTGLSSLSRFSLFFKLLIADLPDDRRRDDLGEVTAFGEVDFPVMYRGYSSY